MTDRDQWLSRYAFKNYAPASDNPAHYGWKAMPPEAALQKRYIRTNPHKLTSMLVVDVDDPEAERTILSQVYTGEVPEPNWLLVNSNTKHAHAGYWLGKPVSTSDVSSFKAMTFLYDTQKKLTAALGGDEHYSHGVTRSPFAEGHATRFLRDEPYELKELAQTLKDIKLLPTYEVDTEQGRNVNLFETVRVRAYSMKKNFKEYAAFFDAVYALTAETNMRMNSVEPLPQSEVKSIAKSIASWTWRRLTPENLSRKQTARVNKRWNLVKNGDLTNETRLLKLAATREEIVFLRQRGLSYSEIARATGMTKDQIKSRLQYARKLGEL